MRYFKSVVPIIIAVSLLCALVILVKAYSWEAPWTGTVAPEHCCLAWDGSRCTQLTTEDGIGCWPQVDFAIQHPTTATVITATWHYTSIFGGVELHTPCGTWGTGTSGDYTYAFPCGSPLAPGVYTYFIRAAGGGEGEFGDLQFLIDSPIPQPGGWPACTTVSNADFDTSSDWTLQGAASLISGALVLSQTGDSAYQDFQIVSNYYTVTVVAMRTSADSSDGLIVAIAPPDGSTGHVAASEPIGIPNDGVYHTMTAVVTPDTLGDGTLHIVSNGSHRVDYICLQPAYGENQCTSESQSFDFEEGYNVDSSFLDWGYGYSQHWRGVEYPLGGYAGGRAAYQCGLAFGCGFATATMFSAKEEATIRYDYMVVPSLITVTASGGGSASVQILTSYDGETWTVAQEKSYASPGVVTFALEYGAPVWLEIASLADTGINLANDAAIYDVQMTGCFAGPNTFPGCIVGDSDFDVSDGYPSRFYWDGAYDSAAGAAALYPEGFIAQALTPPWAGRYTVAIDGSSADYNCLWRVMFTNYGSGVPIASADIPCAPRGAATYSHNFDLEADPVMLWLEQVSGNSSISRVCITPASGQLTCLNQNPDFTDGPTGYTTSNSGHTPVVQAGAAVLAPNYNLYAWDVNYAGMAGPYELQVIASPMISTSQPQLFITDGSIPSSDDPTGIIVTSTQLLTYQIAAGLPAGNGPMIWNAYGPVGEGDPPNNAALISWYCITRSTSISQYIPPTDPYSCTTVANPSFTAGLDNWTANSQVLAVNGVASFAGGGEIAQALASFDVATSTIRWLTHAYAPTDITITVTSDYGSYDFSHSLLAGGGAFYQETAPISGATSITITSGSSGLELDFVCLYPGDTAPPLITGTITGTIQIPPGGQLAQCVAPPMGILPANMTSTLASLWPWGTSPTYFEVLMAYNTAWVRYIGCRLDYLIVWLVDDFWGLPVMGEIARGRCIVGPLGVTTSCGLRGMLDLILAALVFTALTNAITALASTAQLIESALGDIVENIVDTGRTVLYLFGLVGLIIAALIGLLVLLAALIWLIWQIPQEFWTSFRDAATGADAVTLPIPTSSDDPLYNIVVGLQLINQVAGATFLYPVVVLSIVVGSIGILLWTIRQFSVKV